MTPQQYGDHRGAGQGHGGQDRGRTPGGGATVEPGLDALWPGYLKDGYFDASGNLGMPYVSRELVEPLVRAMANARPPLVQHQLRRFFQHCRRIESELRPAGDARWLALRPRFAFLDAAAQDAFGKAPPKIPQLFRDFIRRNVEAVTSKRDFLDGFLPHFEAVVGFGAIHLKKERS
jgi:CRISPR type III-A-associated protein Csm2